MTLQTKLDEITVFYGPLMSLMADCIRGFIIPAKGRQFIAADFSAIEARVLAWLAGEKRILEIFKGDGNVYEHTAAQIFRIPIEKVDEEKRQFGKIANLSLGYGGGKRAFKRFAKAYGLNVSDTIAENIKLAWREANPNIVKYWHALEKAAITSVRTGKKTVVGNTTFSVVGSALWCTLPSGRKLCYMYPRLKEIETPWGELREALTYKLKEENDVWKEVNTYGGKLCENITQAVARDILSEAMFRVDVYGFDIVLHVHDEIVCEVDCIHPAYAENMLLELIELMTIVPEWATGLPLAAAGWCGNRYRK